MFDNLIAYQWEGLCFFFIYFVHSIDLKTEINYGRQIVLYKCLIEGNWDSFFFPFYEIFRSPRGYYLVLPHLLISPFFTLLDDFPVLFLLRTLPFIYNVEEILTHPIIKTRPCIRNLRVWRELLLPEFKDMLTFIFNYTVSRICIHFCQFFLDFSKHHFNEIISNEFP